MILSGGGVELAAQQAGQGKLPRLSIVAYTGKLMRVPGWGPVAIDLAGLDIKGKIPILADHRAEVASVVGHGAASVKGSRLIIEGVVSGAGESASQVVAMSMGGFELQASVGVAPTEYMTVRPGESVAVNGRVLKSPQSFTLVKVGRLKEVTVTPLGADEETSVAIAASQRRERTMENENDGQGTDTLSDPASVIAAERDRVKTIRSICAGFNHMDAQFREKIETLQARAIAGEIDMTELQATVLNELRASRPAGTFSAPNMRSAPAGFNKSEILQAAILCRLGFERVAEKTLGAEATERGSSLRATHGIDLCRAALRMEGRDIPHGRDEMVRAAFSTMTLPNALGDVATKVLLDAYGEAPQSWREFCAIKSVPDFRDAKAVRPSFGGGLEPVAKTGELKHASVTEFSSDFAVNTFGKVLTIDRKDFITDNIGVFSEAASAFGAMTMRSVNDTVYGAILANANGHFHASNANLIEGADSALGVTSLGAAIRKMRVQRDANGNDLDIVPAVLVVPPDMETLAKSVLESEFIAQTVAGMPTGNANRRALKLIVEPRLNNAVKYPTTASATRWFVFAGPQAAPVIAAFLNGKQTPNVEFFGVDQQVNVLALSWRVYMDYGAALCDPKAGVSVKGVA